MVFKPKSKFTTVKQKKAMLKRRNQSEQEYISSQVKPLQKKYDHAQEQINKIQTNYDKVSERYRKKYKKGQMDREEYNEIKKELQAEKNIDNAYWRGYSNKVKWGMDELKAKKFYDSKSILDYADDYGDYKQDKKQAYYRERKPKKIKPTLPEGYSYDPKTMALIDPSGMGMSIAPELVEKEIAQRKLRQPDKPSGYELPTEKQIPEFLKKKETPISPGMSYYDPKTGKGYYKTPEGIDVPATPESRQAIIDIEKTKPIALDTNEINRMIKNYEISRQKYYEKKIFEGKINRAEANKKIREQTAKYREGILESQREKVILKDTVISERKEFTRDPYVLEKSLKEKGIDIFKTFSGRTSEEFHRGMEEIFVTKPSIKIKERELERMQIGKKFISSTEKLGQEGQFTVSSMPRAYTEEELITQFPYTGGETAMQFYQTKKELKFDRETEKDIEESSQRVGKDFEPKAKDILKKYQDKIDKKELSFEEGNKQLQTELTNVVGVMVEKENQKIMDKHGKKVEELNKELLEKQKEITKKSEIEIAKSQIGVRVMKGALTGAFYASTGPLGAVLMTMDVTNLVLDRKEIFESYKRNPSAFMYTTIPELIGFIAGGKSVQRIKSGPHAKEIAKLTKTPKKITAKTDLIEYVTDISKKIKKGDFELKNLGKKEVFKEAIKKGEYIVKTTTPEKIILKRMGKNWVEEMVIDNKGGVKGTVKRDFRHLGRKKNYEIRYNIYDGVVTEGYYRGSKLLNEVKSEFKERFEVKPEIEIEYKSPEKIKEVGPEGRYRELGKFTEASPERYVIKPFSRELFAEKPGVIGKKRKGEPLLGVAKVEARMTSQIFKSKPGFRSEIIGGIKTRYTFEQLTAYTPAKLKRIFQASKGNKELIIEIETALRAKLEKGEGTPKDKLIIKKMLYEIEGAQGWKQISEKIETPVFKTKIKTKLEPTIEYVIVTPGKTDILRRKVVEAIKYTSGLVEGSTIPSRGKKGQVPLSRDWIKGKQDLLTLKEIRKVKEPKLEIEEGFKLPIEQARGLTFTPTQIKSQIGVLGFDTDTDTILDIKSTSLTKTDLKFETRLDTDMALKFDQAQLQAQEQTHKLISDTRLIGATVGIGTSALDVSTETPKIKVPIPKTLKPAKLIPSVEEEPKYVDKQGYNVKVLRQATDPTKRRYQQINTEPLTKRSAKSMMARDLDNTISATGMIVKVAKKIQEKIQKPKMGLSFKKSAPKKTLDTGDKYFEIHQKKFRQFSQRKGKKTKLQNKWIERSRYRGDTVGEVMGLRGRR